MPSTLERYKSGDWNEAEVEVHSDGSATITLRKDKQLDEHKTRVKNIYKENEEELTLEGGKLEQT